MQTKAQRVRDPERTITNDEVGELLMAGKIRFEYFGDGPPYEFDIAYVPGHGIWEAGVCIDYEGRDPEKLCWYANILIQMAKRLRTGRLAKIVGRKP